MNALKGFSIGFDRYERKARITPALLAVAPLVVAAFAWFGREDFGLSILPALGASALVCTVTAAFLSQITRSLGRAKEKKLIARWGGKPSTAIFRHRDTEASSLTKKRHHEWLKNRLGLESFPTAADEEADPLSADEVYSACVDLLKNATRDKQRFYLVAEENSNYGFHRNLWALKPLGIVASLLGTAACALLVWLYWTNDMRLYPVALLGTAINLFFLAAWLFVITPDWVLEPAKAYSAALFNACEALRTDTHTQDARSRS